MIKEFISNQYLLFFIYVFIAVFVAQITRLIYNKVLIRAAKKTKTDMDDKILHLLLNPTYILIILYGLYFAFKNTAVVVSNIVIVDYIFFVATALLIAHIMSKVIAFIFKRIFKDKHNKHKAPKVLSKIISIIIYIIVGIIILNYLGIEITPILATLGIGGLAVGLALQDTLSNFFAGLHIVSDKPINVSDYVKLNKENLEGFVEDIGWRSTTIKTIASNYIVIPNKILAESTILNHSMPNNEMSLFVGGGVDYKSDLDKVEKTIISVAKKIQNNTDGAVKDFKPMVRFYEFGESNIKFIAVLRIAHYVSQYKVRTEFVKNLKKEFDKQGIEISWPIVKLVDAGKLKKKK